MKTPPRKRNAKRPERNGRMDCFRRRLNRRHQEVWRRMPRTEKTPLMISEQLTARLVRQAQATPLSPMLISIRICAKQNTGRAWTVNNKEASVEVASTFIVKQ